jgi:hypothetical protein
MRKAFFGNLGDAWRSHVAGTKGSGLAGRGVDTKPGWRFEIVRFKVVALRDTRFGCDVRGWAVLRTTC